MSRLVLTLNDSYTLTNEKITFSMCLAEYPGVESAI
ncbi:MAG: hypothetical protein RL060_572 [Bacteroidota bacterium]